MLHTPQVSKGGGEETIVAGGGSEGRGLAAYELLPLLETLRAVLLHAERGRPADSAAGRRAHHLFCDGAGGRGDTVTLTEAVEAHLKAYFCIKNISFELL